MKISPTTFFRSKFILFIGILALCFGCPIAAKDAAKIPNVLKSSSAAAVSYQLPSEGALPQTYLVTLAIVDPKNPDWILSTFVAGAPRTVTAENKGKFTETWDGLDENYMPLPPGSYAVKGIYMPAKKWEIDDEWHAIIPKYAGAISGWWPRVDAPTEKLKAPFGGDPVSSPFGDVAVAPSGIAVFYYQYLENGLNCPMVDLTKPGVSPDQFIKSFNSGGAAGGSSVATDGESVWAFSTDGGPKFVYRADGKPFGKSPGCNRVNSYPPEGWVTSMAAWKDETTQKSFVYIAQRGKIVPQKIKNWTRHVESDSDFANLITVHDGADGKVLATLPIAKPQGLSVQNGRLYVLHTDEKGFLVSSLALQNGLPAGSLQTTFRVPSDITPFDAKVDSKDRFYLSDSKANKVYQLDAGGKVLRTFGKLAAQKPGSYDPMTLMAPTKLATWKDAEGKDRLIIVEKAGPNRVAEWNPENGELIRDFQTYQTFTNNSGYAVDPEHPEDLYIQGQDGWFVRFKVDYEKHTFAVDAVWPLEKDPRLGIDPARLDTFPGKLVLSRANGQLYIVGTQKLIVFHVTDDRCALSAALIKDGEGKDAKYSFWSDANGNGVVEDSELTPTQIPGNFFSYHGQNWLEDLTYLAVNMGGRDLWRLSPAEFDQHGNPIFKEWTKVLTDPVFEAKSKGVVDALYGGNEVGDRFSSDWMQADGSLKEGFYVQARSGYSFNANEGAEHKISYYAPDKDGSFKQKWRVGRSALQWTAHPGEIYGAMRIHRPINGILSVTDQSRCGIVLYTQDGLYVDTLFPDSKRVSVAKGGLFLLPGEYFTGSIFPNKNNGKVYLGLGKYTPTFFETEGWSLKESPVKALKSLPKKITLASSQISTPPEIALTIRGGAGTAKVARFSPALGGAVLDGSMTGWESCDPVQYQSDKDQTVEVRCLYDADHLYLRWHARFTDDFELKALPPLPRIFTHDQLSRTLDFYFQGNPEAKPGTTNGRAGDARFVFGIFKDGTGVRPVGVGMYPTWEGKGASPQKYRTPVGEASFAHVGAIAGAQYGYVIDPDNKGFVLAAAIPRAAIPALQTPFGGDLHTLINFSANFGGHNKFWWANSDATANKETYDEPSEARLYPGSWAPVQFKGIEDGVIVKKWMICGPFGGPGAEKLTRDPNGLMPGTNKNWKDATKEFCEAQKYPLDDLKVDPTAVYKGGIVQGYWNNPGEVRWRVVTTADLDTRVKLGDGGQVWYGVTWINAPAATELEFDFQSHMMTPLRWFVNGEPIDPGKYAEFKTSNNIRYQTASKTLSLRPGWNQVMFRGYNFGGPPFRVGLVLKGAPEKLWPLRLSAEVPK